MPHYTVAGLILACEIALPGLSPVSPEERDADVRICLGKVPPSLEGVTARGPNWQVAGNRFLLQIPKVARFLIEDGRSVIAEPAPAVPTGDIAIFLAGTVFGILLHQRGHIVLHASAVRVGDRAALFCGSSGSGKSTLAATLNRRGYALITDDLCVLRLVENDVPHVLPDGRQLKLWEDTVDKLGLLRGEPVRSVLRKYFVEPVGAVDRPIRLGAVYILREARPSYVEGIERANLADAALFVRQNAFRPQLVSRLGLKASYFDAAARIAASGGIYRLTRAKKFEQMDGVVETLETHWAMVGLI